MASLSPLKEASPASECRSESLFSVSSNPSTFFHIFTAPPTLLVARLSLKGHFWCMTDSFPVIRCPHLSWDFCCPSRVVTSYFSDLCSSCLLSLSVQVFCRFVCNWLKWILCREYGDFKCMSKFSDFYCWETENHALFYFHFAIMHWFMLVYHKNAIQYTEYVVLKWHFFYFLKFK